MSDLCEHCLAIMVHGNIMLGQRKLEMNRMKDIMDIVEANLTTLTISPFSEAGINFDNTERVPKAPLRAIKDGKWIR